MDEKTLLKISMICSLIGILILMFISERISLAESNISKINKDMVDKNVKVKGSITSIKDTPSVLLLTIEDNNGSIPAVIFKEDDSLNLQKGNIIEIEGTIMEYNNKLEIEAKTIKIF